MPIAPETLKELIKDAVKLIIDSKDFKIILIDSDGNIVGDIPLSTLTRTRVYEQSFESGTSDLTADYATQTVQSSEVYSGSYALQVTISAGQTGYVETPVRHVSPSQEITVVFAHKEDANITGIKLIVVWYRTNMRELATEEFTLDVSDTWQLDSRTVTAPKKAAYMAVRIQATAGSSDGNVYIDDITIDLVGQIFRVDGAGQIKVADTDLLDEMQTKLDVLLSTRASENTLAEARDKLSSIDGKVATEDTLSAIKNALDSVGTDKIRASVVDTLPESPFNLSKVAGTALTGRDWSSDFAKLQNLDLAITALRDALKGSNNRDFSTLEADVESILAQMDVSLSTRASEDTLSGIKTQIDKLQFNANNLLRIALSSDEIGIAKDDTIKSELTRLAKLRIYDDTLATPDWVNLSRSILRESKIIEDAVGLAKESTLSSIDGKVVKVDTDNVKVISEVAYDSTNDRKKVSIENDSVGLLKAADLDIDANKRLGIRLEVDKVGLAKDSTLVSRLARELELDDGTGTYGKIYRSGNALLISIYEDKVGLAKETTLSSINGKITKVDTDNVKVVSEVAYDSANDWKKISIENDAVGLLKEGGNVNVANFPSDFPDSGTHSRLDDIKGALDSVGTDKIRTSVVDALPESPFNLSKVAGTALTGRDWSSDFAKLQNLDLTLSSLRDDLRGVDSRTLTDLYNKINDLLTELQPVSAKGSIASADNTDGFEITLDKGGRRLVDVYYKLGGAGDLIIEVSNDGSTWRPYYSTNFSASAEDIYSFETSFRYVRVRTPTTGIDVEFEITATR